jgi:hypothetical protein
MGRVLAPTSHEWKEFYTHLYACLKDLMPISRHEVPPTSGGGIGSKNPPTPCHLCMFRLMIPKGLGSFNTDIKTSIS